MTIEEIYKKTAEGFDALQFNIGLLFDEMEKGLNQRKLPLCKKLWYKARLSIMRKQYRKTTHLIRFGCRFLDLKYINEITYIRSMQVIGVFEEEGHYRWEMSGNGGIRDKADISPREIKRIEKSVRLFLVRRNLRHFLQRWIPFSKHRSRTSSAAGNTDRSRRTKGIHHEWNGFPPQCSDGILDTPKS